MEDKGFRPNCNLHSGVRAEMDDLKTSDRDQWDKIGMLQTSKASSAQMKWVIGIFLILSISIVGFLWRTQVSSTDTIIKKIEVMEDKNAVKRDETNNKLDTLKDRFNELKWSVDELKKGDRKKGG